ncbi:unnamed protein product [Lathyrus oleraceus]
MDSKRSRSTKKGSWNDLAFINNVISWSLEDIFDQDLYKNQVDSIGLSFDSAKQYLNSFVPPLLEETRAQLCSCIEIISSSSHAQVFFFSLHTHFNMVVIFIVLKQVVFPGMKKSFISQELFLFWLILNPKQLMISKGTEIGGIWCFR